MEPTTSRQLVDFNDGVQFPTSPILVMLFQQLEYLELLGAYDLFQVLSPEANITI